jgi:hypothetical protein
MLGWNGTSLGRVLAIHSQADDEKVGNGMLAAAVSGEVFASPSTKQVMAAIKHTPSDRHYPVHYELHWRQSPFRSCQGEGSWNGEEGRDLEDDRRCGSWQAANVKSRSQRVGWEFVW